VTAGVRTRARLRLLVSTLKGGPGKTTTAVFTAIGLARRGLKVVLICADTRTRGALDWIQEAVRQGYGVPFTLVVWHESDGPLSVFAQNTEREQGADVVIVDTGGEQPEAFTHGALFADRLICPVGPMNGELRRIVETYRHAAAVDEMGSPVLMSVLLTRVPQVRRGKARIARTDLEATDATADKPYRLGLHVMETEITRAGPYEECYGLIPDDLGEYEDLTDELVGELDNPAAEEGDSESAAPVGTTPRAV
jgi:cellulose biosynthesis protein BcsQ